MESRKEGGRRSRADLGSREPPWERFEEWKVRVRWWERKSRERRERPEPWLTERGRVRELEEKQAGGRRLMTPIFEHELRDGLWRGKKLLAFLPDE